MTAAPLLSVRAVQAFYGPVRALGGVSLDVFEGEIVTLIGANGAGKSTLLMTICGNPAAAAGAIHFDGADITAEATHCIIRRGIAQAPEGRRIFAHMTVLENLLIGTTAAATDGVEDDLARVFELFPVLKERARQRGGTLSGGEQQMLAISRALMGRPRLLLLDEPSLGLAPIVVRRIFDVIGELNRSRGMTIFLVEQNAYHALALAHRGYVLANGEIVMQGTGRELLADERIRAAYLEGGVA
jgi:branched-chain amino acid transport system ATP-binding protein